MSIECMLLCLSGGNMSSVTGFSNSRYADNTINSLDSALVDDLEDMVLRGKITDLDIFDIVEKDGQEVIIKTHTFGKLDLNDQSSLGKIQQAFTDQNKTFTFMYKGKVIQGKRFAQILDRAKSSNNTQKVDQIYGLVHPRKAEALRSGNCCVLTDSETMKISTLVQNILEKLELEKSEKKLQRPLTSRNWSEPCQMKMRQAASKNVASEKVNGTSQFVYIRKMEMGVLDKSIAEETRIQEHYEAIVKTDKLIKNLHINKQQETGRIIQTNNDAFEVSRTGI
jgi:hypothetical protein